VCLYYWYVLLPRSSFELLRLFSVLHLQDYNTTSITMVASDWLGLQQIQWSQVNVHWYIKQGIPRLHYSYYTTYDSGNWIHSELLVPTFRFSFFKWLLVCISNGKKKNRKLMSVNFYIQAVSSCQNNVKMYYPVHISFWYMSYEIVYSI